MRDERVCVCGGGPEYRQRGGKKTTARYVTGREHRDKLIIDRQEQRKCASGGGVGAKKEEEEEEKEEVNCLISKTHPGPVKTF